MYGNGEDWSLCELKIVEKPPSLELLELDAPHIFSVKGYVKHYQQCW